MCYEAHKPTLYPASSLTFLDVKVNEVILAKLSFQIFAMELTFIQSILSVPIFYRMYSVQNNRTQWVGFTVPYVLVDSYLKL